MTDNHFVYKAVEGRQSDDPVLTAIHRLRYQVYVNEWGFEKPEDHPEGLERDEYDRHCLHFYARSHTSDDVVGSARIILGSELPFPIERHFDISRFPIDGRRETAAEISRLAISKDYRRRAIDRVIFSNVAGHLDEVGETLGAGQPAVHEERRKCEHELIRGLYLLIYRESLRLGLTHWYAVMARGLYVILRRWGIDFRQIGPEQDYHGVRAPYVVDIRAMEKSLAENNPELASLAKIVAP